VQAVKIIKGLNTTVTVRVKQNPVLLPLVKLTYCLAWVKQHYVRDETLTAANARLVATANQDAIGRTDGGTQCPQ
jgi:hypothetical protein